VNGNHEHDQRQDARECNKEAHEDQARDRAFTDRFGSAKESLMPRRRRSCLSVPGTSAKMLAKAASLPADELVLDLEDAVAPADKSDATRTLVVDAVRRGADAATVAIRINGVGTPWWRDDLAAVAAARPHCVVVPKVESADDVAAVAALLPDGTGIEAQIETARGLVHVEQIAAAGNALEALLFGPGDMAASLGMPELTIGGGGDRWHYALARIVTAARACGLQAIDGPYARLGDLDGLRESARRSRDLGYDGKWAIHPEQLEPLNELYAPTDAELERARRILDAAAGAGRLGDEMIDEVSLKLAESILARRP
jgi:citrate lyase subunit beta/citryl-CoA lyase